MHAATALAAVHFVCENLDASVKFYRALGVDVRETKQAGVVSYTCALAGVHFALRAHDGVARGPQSSIQLGFMISNLDGAMAALTSALAASGAGKILEKPNPKPWGLTALVEDPDGRRIELVSTKVEMTGPMPF
jgi:predicted enzyme related to lactoylglutathione lyase